MPPITLFFLQASRSIRSAWLLEELGLDYNVKFSERVNQKAPEQFKLDSSNPLGKFPTLKDGGLVSGRLLPTNAAQRVKVRQWVHAVEATFALAILYTRWNIKDVPEGTIAAAEERMSANVQNDLPWLETELSLSQGPFLCGDHVTAADIVMQFSTDLILVRELGTQGKERPNINKRSDACKNTETCKRAVQKTGYKL
ncbi:hypothetical protein GQ44DRAFT_612886 [Phaeosphaeriaceae sp. PMI808]|nr:hypothetical protein GQ44DRAFT_612886 [Phaeosphaeriaceae sp. PMI808]